MNYIVFIIECDKRERLNFKALVCWGHTWGSVSSDSTLSIGINFYWQKKNPNTCQVCRMVLYAFLILAFLMLVFLMMAFLMLAFHIVQIFGFLRPVHRDPAGRDELCVAQLWCGKPTICFTLFLLLSAHPPFLGLATKNKSKLWITFLLIWFWFSSLGPAAWTASRCMFGTMSASSLTLTQVR